ncbi:DNA gyrase inhibitor YacG [Pelagibacteraceae bacterium]|nr:DNA gyrase inhibitor YacG [Pelagibacteraceae bacterium]
MEVKNSSNNKILSLNKRSQCPNCKKIAKEPFIPFCSKKCASIDLMKWLTDEHQINIKID